MKSARWLALLLPSFAMSVAAYPVAPLIAAADALFGEPRTRALFGWFVTPDNPLAGDSGHEARHAGRPRWYKVVAWHWRNRAYGFDANVLRADTRGPVTVDGDRLVGNHPLRQGAVWRTTPEGYWQFYYVRRNPLVKGRCIRVNLGWKLWDAPDTPLFGQYVFAVNPFMGYTD